MVQIIESHTQCTQFLELSCNMIASTLNLHIPTLTDYVFFYPDFKAYYSVLSKPGDINEVGKFPYKCEVNSTRNYAYLSSTIWVRVESMLSTLALYCIAKWENVHIAVKR